MPEAKVNSVPDCKYKAPNKARQRCGEPVPFSLLVMYLPPHPGHGLGPSGCSPAPTEASSGGQGGLLSLPSWGRCGGKVPQHSVQRRQPLLPQSRVWRLRQATQRPRQHSQLPPSQTSVHQHCAPSPSLQPPPFPSFPILLYCFLGKGAGFQPLHLMCPIDSW